MSQIFFKKKGFFFIVFLLVSHFMGFGQALFFSKADSAYMNKNWVLADSLLTQNSTKNINTNPKIYLKLAYIASTSDDVARELYHLNQYYLKKPEGKIFSKMNEIASKNSLNGYEKNDLNYLLLLLQQYGAYGLSMLVALGLYVFSVFIYKRSKKENISLRDRLIFVVFIASLLALATSPIRYKYAILKEDEVTFRSYNSAGAGIIDHANKGHRLNVLGEEDIWLKVLWKKQVCYVKRNQAWVVE